MPVNVTTRNDMLVVSGSIDETASFEPLIQSDKNQINWRAVTSINSFGVGRLLEAVHSMSHRHLTFTECPIHLMDAFVMIPALLGPEDSLAKIESFFVEYTCGACDVEIKVLLHTKEIRIADNVLSAPEQCCSNCKKPLAMNDEAQNYIELRERGAF